MKIRLSTLDHKTYRKIRARQNHGTMSAVYDDEDYLCFIKEEFDRWESRKVGRKVKLKRG